MASEPDWTLGPAKWIAVGVLGAASVAGMTWTIAQKYPTQPGGTVIQPPPPRAEAPPPYLPPQRELLAIPDPEPPAEPPREEGDLLADLAGKPRPTAVEGPVVTPPPVDRSPQYARIINVNTAPAAELELLPGIGPALAWRIVEYRQMHGPFGTVEELTEVRGIGPKTLERLRPRVRVE